MKTFGLFNSAAFNRTLRIHNGKATLIDMERIVQENDISTPDDVWNAIMSEKGTPCPDSVFDSDSWISRGSARADYKISYGLPDDYDIVTNHKAMVAANRSVKEIVKEAGLTNKKLSARFGIPIRTVDDWTRGASKCPLYTRLMMQECLGLYSYSKGAKEMTDIEILMADGCTRSDAERSLKKGTLIFNSIDEYIEMEKDNGLLDDLLEDYDGSEDALREALKDGAVPDIGYVDGRVIMYVL